MPVLYTPDQRYLFAVETAGEGDGNSFIIDQTTGEVVWSRFSYEAGLGAPPAPPDPLPVPPPPPMAAPTPVPAAPLPPPSGALAHLIRVTNVSNGVIIPRTYSYWPNAWVANGDVAYVFCGIEGTRPQFFHVRLSTGAVEWLGERLPYGGTGEGWYWDLDGWVYLLDGPRLRRCNPFDGEDRIIFDISETHPKCDLWQAHSSDDGRTHSATVRQITAEGSYPYLGTVVCRDGRQDYFPAQGSLDESQITPDGTFLVIKEDENNRVINLISRDTRVIADADGAVGHSDCGPGILVGEDNIHGACVLWDLRQPLVPERRRELFKTWGMGHLSIRGGRCLLSTDTDLSLIALDGSGVTPLLAHGMVGSGYDFQVKANLDPSGRVACFLSNCGGDRQDIFLLDLAPA